MKLNKIVTLTLINSFTLLVFASILASCQKNSYSRHGFFSPRAKLRRSFASVNRQSDKDKFMAFQDPKQIFIYCSMTSVKVKQCYKQELNKIVTTYIRKFGPFKPEEIKHIFTQTEYESTKREMNTHTTSIISGMTSKMEHQVMDRREFCIKNSKFYLRRCLNQYLERDSFVLINKFQNQHKGLNGHEYLYLKKTVELTMREKLQNIEDEIKADRQPANS